MIQTDTETRSTRILFAEDEIGFRDSMAKLLQRDGYDCTCAGSFNEAVQAGQELEYDLLLMDIRMPGNQGLSLAREVLKNSPRIVVIVITGFPSTDTAIEGIDLSVHAYLSKPITYNELKSKIEMALREQQTLHGREQRLHKLEEGFKRVALQLQSMGHQTGLLGDGFEPAQIPELKDLSARQWQVLAEVMNGYRVNAIAEKLIISPHTVRNHLRAIFTKVGVRSQSELMVKLRPFT